MIKTLVIISFTVLAFSCRPLSYEADRSESVVDMKKRLWLATPRDVASKLRTINTSKLKQSIPVGRPASFLISADSNLYISDNAYGRLFKVSPDFQSITEFGIPHLLNPTTIREANDKLFVYDDNGINIFQKDGQLINVVKPYLKVEDFDLIDENSYVVSLAE